MVSLAILTVKNLKTGASFLLACGQTLAWRQRDFVLRAEGTSCRLFSKPCVARGMTWMTSGSTMAVTRLRCALSWKEWAQTQRSRSQLKLSALCWQWIFMGPCHVKDGSFRTAKKAKFAKEASDLLSKMPARFSNLEKQMKTKVTLNALVAALPELSLVSASLMDSPVLPGLLQLGIKLSVKSDIRSEIDGIIGSIGKSNPEAKKTATKGQDARSIGLSGDPLLGGKALFELARQIEDHWVEKPEVNQRVPIAKLIEAVAHNPNHFLDIACGDNSELHAYALEMCK